MTHRARNASIVAALLFVVGAACGGSAPTLMLETPPIAENDPRLRGGVAQIDVTPPPGLALAGHGPEGRVSTGTRLRLRCQAFVLTQGSESIAVVPCDLWAISTELHYRVVDLLRRQDVPLGVDRVLLMATHTHGAPGHYFGADMYSGTYATRLPGFDPDVVEFLASRIATAIAFAYGSRVPVRVGWRQHAVYGLTRNRSFGAFAANLGTPPSATSSPTAPAREFATRPLSPTLREMFSPSTGSASCGFSGGQACLDTSGRPALSLPPAERAVDPTLSVLRIDTESAPRKTLGVLAVFGVHNTAIGNTNTLYHGDVFGFASREAARRIACLESVSSSDPAAVAACAEPTLAIDVERDRRVVVGIANGAEGDVSPRWDFQAARESRRIGEALGMQIFADYRALDALEANGSGALASVYHEARLPGAAVHGARRLCGVPSIGTPMLGGTTDGLSRFRVLPRFSEGHRSYRPAHAWELPRVDADRDADVCHGPKLRLLPVGGDFSADGTHFPIDAPFSVVRIGNGALAAAPAELTTAVGMRLREVVRAALHAPESGIEHVAVVGLVNSYLQYVTTVPEYNAQAYEGASTLYGPDSVDFFDRSLGCVARRLAGVSGDATAFCGGDEAPGREAARTKVQAPSSVTRLRDVPTDLAPLVNTAAPAVRQIAEDAVVGWEIAWEGYPPEALRTHAQQTVAILDATGRIIDDDRGASMLVEHLGDRRWRAAWVPSQARCGRGLRFQIAGLVRLRSAPFDTGCATTDDAYREPAQ